jgi:hypothetical protein
VGHADRPGSAGRCPPKESSSRPTTAFKLTPTVGPTPATRSSRRRVTNFCRSALAVVVWPLVSFNKVRVKRRWWGVVCADRLHELHAVPRTSTRSGASREMRRIRSRLACCRSMACRHSGVPFASGRGSSSAMIASARRPSIWVRPVRSPAAPARRPVPVHRLEIRRERVAIAGLLCAPLVLHRPLGCPDGPARVLGRTIATSPPVSAWSELRSRSRSWRTSRDAVQEEYEEIGRDGMPRRAVTEIPRGLE